jgi:hypothetical protein
MKYKLKKATEFSSDILIATNDNGDILYIPIDEANADYQRYLNPEAEQSTPSLENGTIS